LLLLDFSEQYTTATSATSVTSIQVPHIPNNPWAPASAGSQHSYWEAIVQGSDAYVQLNKTFYDPAYVIPDSAAGVVHVNAANLLAGTAKVGPVWTSNGTPVEVPGTIYPFLPEGVGPLTDSNYYDLATSNVLNFTGDFTMAIIFNPGVWSGTGQVIFNNGVYSASGLIVERVTNAILTVNYSQADGGVAFAQCNSVASNVTNVLVFGRSGLHNYAILNGVAQTGSDNTEITAGTGQSTLGNYLPPSPGLDSNSIIYELWASTDTPTPASLAAIYNAIHNNLATPPAPLVPVGFSEGRPHKLQPGATIYVLAKTGGTGTFSLVRCRE
jgi:hypothetical protein